MKPLRILIAGLTLSLLPDLAALAYPATVVTALNVRSGPGTYYPVVGQLRAGDGVDISATRGAWVHVANYGWVNGNYLDLGGILSEPIYRPEDYSMRPGYVPYDYLYGDDYGYGYSYGYYPYYPYGWRAGRYWRHHRWHDNRGWYGRPRVGHHYRGARRARW